MNKIHTLIRTNYHTLSEAQKRIADLFLSESYEMIHLTLSEIAKRTDTSETTILRFLKKIGYSSYPIFRVDLAKELSLPSKNSTELSKIYISDSLEEAKYKLLQRTVEAIGDLDAVINLETVEQFAKLMTTSERICITGFGPAGPGSLDFYHKLLKLGLPISYIADPMVTRTASNALSENDLLVAISHSGEDKDLIEACKLAKSHEAKIASITSYKNSTLAELSDIVMTSSTYESPTQGFAMVSRIVQILVMDLIYISLLQHLGDKGHEMMRRFWDTISPSKS